MRDETKAVFFRTTNQLSHSGRLGYANNSSVEQKSLINLSNEVIKRLSWKTK